MGIRRSLRGALARALAALLAIVTVLGTTQSMASPGDIFQSSAPVLGADPPKAAELRAGEVSVSNTGALTYAYPIATPPGRGGMAPRVSLGYASQAPIYGTIATGWSLSIPAILEDTSEGRLRTKAPEVETQQDVVTAAADDQFLSTLAGNRPLIKVTEPTSAGVAQTYRSQNDTSYTRYERMYTGTFLWRAYTSSGIVMTFGEAIDANGLSRAGACSSVLGPGYAPLTGEIDPFGSEIIYEYEWSVDLGECRIKQITWGMNANAGVAAFAKLAFTWVTPTMTLGYAAGAQRDYRTGKLMTFGAGRLTTITATAFPPGAPGSPSHTRRISLGYETAYEANTGAITHAPMRFLKTIQESAWGTGIAQVDLPPVTFTYADPGLVMPALTSPLTRPWSAAFPHAGNLGWGYRHPYDDRWASVEAMMVDIDGDGLLDRVINNSVDGGGAIGACSALWQRNRGPDPANPTQLLPFGSLIPIALPRLAWRSNSATASRGVPYKEGCALNGQVTAYNNSHELSNVCHDGNACGLSADPLKSSTPFCYPGGTTCPLDLEGGGGPAGEFRTYLAYRWLDADGDGMTDLVAAIHGDIDAYDVERGNDTGALEPVPFGMGGWPACPTQMVDTCKDLGRCLTGAAGPNCSGGLCQPNWAEVNNCLNVYGTSNQSRGCFKIMARLPPAVSGGPVKRSPYMRCEGLYPWFIWKNAGNGSFPTTPTVKYQPVPLESDQGDSALTGPLVFAENHAVLDFDGDGRLDAIAHGKEDPGDNPDGWYAWLGDGFGGIGPKRYYFPTRDHTGDKNRISAADGTLQGQLMGLLDANGDGLPDHWLDNGDGTANLAFHDGTSFEVYGTAMAGATNTPSGYTLKPSNVTASTPPGAIDSGTAKATNRPLDVDGDGRIDVVTWAGATASVFFNLGGQFHVPAQAFPGASTTATRDITASTVMAPTDFYEDHLWELNAELMDLDGDGIAEGVSATSSTFGRAIYPAVPPRLMTSIKNGRGATSAVTYASMHDTTAVEQHPELFGIPNGWFDGRPKATPREQWVVKSIRVDDDFDAFPSSGTTTAYKYANPRHGADDLGYFAFRGFETVTTTSQSGAKTVQTYGFDVDWSGRLVKTVAFAAEAPAAAVTVGKTAYTSFSLFSGAVKTFHATQSEHFTCVEGQTEAACTASATAPAAYTKTDSTYVAKASDTTPNVPLMFVVSESRTQHAAAPADGDRVLAQTFMLAADGATYRLRPDTAIKQVQQSGALVTYGKSRTTWDATAPIYARKLTDEVWVDAIDANRSVTTYQYEATTGNLLSVTTPRGNTTSYEYDPRKLFVAFENSPVYVHDLEFDYEYGTGATLETRGPNVAWCLQVPPYNCPGQVMLRDANKVVIDGIGRPLERWESVTVDPSGAAYFELKKVETTSYVDTPVGTVPTSVTHQAALKEVAGVISYTQDKTELDGHGRPTKVTQLALGAAPADHVTSYVYRLDGTLQTVSVPDPRVSTSATVAYTYTFDSLGRPTTVRRPDSPQSGVDMTYSRQTPANGGVRSTTTEVASGSSVKKAAIRRTLDADGHLVKVEETTASMTTWVATVYAYSADDNVKQITDPEGKITLLTHDQAGHRTQIERYGRKWDYTYDKDGNVETEIAPCDPQPACRVPFMTTFIYDTLDRVAVKNLAPRTLTDPDLALFGAAQESFQYDVGSNARGRLSQWHAWAPGLVETQNQLFSYDPQGRPLSNWMSFNSAGYSKIQYTAHSYFLGGRPQRTTYADQANGGTLYTVSDVAYDARGLPASVAVSVDNGATFQPSIVETRNVAGLVTKRRVDYPASPPPPMAYAESVWTYDVLGRVTDQKVNRSPGSPVQVARQELIYFGNDDVSRLTTSFGTTAKRQDFTYDFRHQLKTVVSTPSSYFGATYNYGNAGRFTQATVTQTINPLPSGTEVKPRNVYYNYAGTDPELVTSLNTGSPTGAAYVTYTYDPAGNQLTKTEAATGDAWTYLYDGKDQLRRATKRHNGVVTGSEEYWYDVGGARENLVKRDAAGAITEMVWFHEGIEAHYSPAGTVTNAYSHVSLGTSVARIDWTGDFATTTEYQFHGLANSTLATISSSGTINTRFNYAPFGELVESSNGGGAGAGTAVHKRRFNDKQQDDLTGLSYYGARYYDRTLMGWTQVDPLYLRVPDLGKQSTPRRSNLAAFSLNNPVRYMDPDGLDSVGRNGADIPISASAQFDRDIRGRMAGDGGYVDKDACSHNSNRCSFILGQSYATAEADRRAAHEWVHAGYVNRPRTVRLSWALQGGHDPPGVTARDEYCLSHRGSCTPTLREIAIVGGAIVGGALAWAVAGWAFGGATAAEAGVASVPLLAAGPAREMISQAYATLANTPIAQRAAMAQELFARDTARTTTSGWAFSAMPAMNGAAAWVGPGGNVFVLDAAGRGFSGAVGDTLRGLVGSQFGVVDWSGLAQKF